MPLIEHSFYPNKSTYWGSIRIRYNIPLVYLPSTCVDGQLFNIKHTRLCKKGGFIILRHNELSDFTTDQLTKVCHDVLIESQLKPLTGEIFNYKSWNTAEDGRVTVSARNFWVLGQVAFSE